MTPEQIKCLNSLSRGRSQVTIARMLRVSTATISSWIKDYDMRNLIDEMESFPIYLDALRELRNNVEIAMNIRDIEYSKFKFGDDGKVTEEGDANLILKANSVIHNLIQPFLENQNVKLELTFSNEINLNEIFGNIDTKNERIIEAASSSV